MTAPIRHLPPDVDRWISRLAWLRGGDAVIAFALLALALAWIAGSPGRRAAVIAAVVVAAAALVQPLRTVWRPLSGAVGLAVSRDLRPGDRAWYVRARHADAVLVTACHGARVVIAPPDVDEPDEVLSVRRTRVILLPIRAV